MASGFHLSVVAPDKSVAEVEITSAILPAHAGYMGVLKGHSPVIAALRPGLLEYTDSNDQRHHVALSGGFAEVTATKITVLADAAERANEIDIARAQRALDEARKALRGEASGIGAEQATAEIERALNRIKAAKGG